MSKVKVEVESIRFDVADIYQKIPAPVWTSKEGDGVDGRIEIYNEYGSTKGVNDYRLAEVQRFHHGQLHHQRH